jgi:hypothetical protein
MTSLRVSWGSVKSIRGRGVEIGLLGGLMPLPQPRLLEKSDNVAARSAAVTLAQSITNGTRSEYVGPFSWQTGVLIFLLIALFLG